MELTIHKVEKNHIKPYLKKYYLFPTTYFLMSLDKFKNYIEREMENCDGEFLLRDTNAKPFVRFRIKEGKMVKIWRTSPTTRRIYPIWKRMC